MIESFSVDMDCVSRNQWQSLGLTLTGHDSPDNIGDDDGMSDDKDNGHDKFRYRITVMGTGVEEYYEYDEKQSPGTVEQDWLDDVRERWGNVVANQMQQGIQVEKLWQQTESQDSEEQSAALPAPEDRE